MINYEDIKSIATEWNIAEQVVEKNYVIGWVLWGIGGDPDIGHKWIFKGGTCIKKCYLDTYRFSEDLDFTILPDAPYKPEEIEPILNRIIKRVNEESGINFSLKPIYLKQKDFPYYTEGRIYYQGPRGTPTPASIKLDLVASEKVVHPPTLRKIAHNFPEDLPETAHAMCYTIEEIFAEKIRAMGERSAPRDLYDIIFLFRDGKATFDHKLVRSILIAKCENKKVSLPTYDSIAKSPFIEELKSEWANMLAHQLPSLPPFEGYWDELPNLFNWLEGNYKEEKLPEISREKGETLFKPSPALWSVVKKAPLEAIRYAAINHLCVNLGYGGLRRLIEPYSLRQSKDGNLILYAFKVADHEIHAYRIDRIQGVEITTQTFRPRFRIEFPSVGIIYAPTIRRKR
jgi:predicted nucleotidyltransferase component of viral defense system